jgi:hypothetical protein
MRERMRSVLFRSTLLFSALAVLTLAAAAPAQAAGVDYKGFFVALDLASTQPTGLDQRYAVTIDFTNPQAPQEFKFFDNSAGFSGSLRLGYSFGELGGLEATYWSFDNDDSLKSSEGTSTVYPLVFGGYAYNNAGSYGLTPPSTYQVTSSIKAKTTDVDYFRVMEAGEKFTIKWIGGLRAATYEEDLKFEGTDAGYYAAYPLKQTRHIDTSAFGVKAGVKLSYGLTEHFGLQGSMAFSVLQGQTDQKTTQVGTLQGTTSNVVDELKLSADNIHGEIRDYDLRAVWSWPRFDFYVGYGGQTWEGLVKDRTGDQISLFTAQPTKSNGDDRNTIGFMSYHAGVVWRFGKE